MKFLEKLNSTELDLSALNSWTARKTFGLKRAEFYESLGGMIRDGTPSLRALEFICNVETDFGTRKGTSGMYWPENVLPP